MNLDLVLDEWRRRPALMENVTHWETIPKRSARYAPFPSQLDERLRSALEKRGIRQLYTHQAEAFERVMAGQNTVVVTPTASGKTLCYNLPVLHTILQDASARALYLFPTKALAQDQMMELHEVVETLESDIKTFTYDGDTPATARQAIRQAGHVVVTNPDMLHSGILPHHTKWVKLFENLRYVVIDEIHMYRGVFGSHVSNVIKRLRRICQFYGSNPRFICASATIANPAELAHELFNVDFHLIDQHGAPSGERHFLLYNPPVVNRQLGIRRSSLLEVRQLSTELLRRGVQTIAFARSRVQVEVLLTYLQQALRGVVPTHAVRGYRGGYLPTERRAIERGLRAGEVRGVVSTNALELGIDIGSLEACVMAGYPGTIASSWQRAGRAGRRSGQSVTVMVASSSPLDQYIVQHPEYFFHASPEYGRVHPENLLILVDHIKCAAYELPFDASEQFGVSTTEEVLDYLTTEKVLNRSGNKFYWMTDALPSHEISLRSAAQENVVIIDTTSRAKVIGEMDRLGAMTMLHEEAIYIHEGEQYQVEKLDFAEKKAYVRHVDVDYYTDAELAVNLRVLDVFQEVETAGVVHAHGEVMINAMPTIFKKIKFDTHENIGSGPIHLPEAEMHSLSYMVSFGTDITASMEKHRLQDGLVAAANVLVHVAPLFLMCDPRDVHVVPQMRALHRPLPTIFLYDAYPGGVGLSDKLFEVRKALFTAARDLLVECSCEDGCPSCCGAHGVPSIGRKETARHLLEAVAYA